MTALNAIQTRVLTVIECNQVDKINTDSIKGLATQANLTPNEVARTCNWLEDRGLIRVATNKQGFSYVATP